MYNRSFQHQINKAKKAPNNFSEIIFLGLAKDKGFKVTKANEQQNIYEHWDFKIEKERFGKNPCTLEEMKEFFQDGCDIIDFFKKKRLSKKE